VEQQDRMADIERQLHCVVVTPERTVLETSSEFVALPLYDGEIGIAPSHSPLIGRLGYGEMRIRRDGAVERYYVDGGFVQVLSDTVTVLTGRAIPAEQVDVQVAQEQLAEALRRPAHTEELLSVRDRVITQSRAQIRVAGRVAE